MMKRIYNVYAAMLIAGTVAMCAPYAHAVVIKNTVESHANTGGRVSVDGADGADGADGRDGEDGASAGMSEIRIETYINGEKVEDIHEVRVSEDGTSLRASTASASAAAVTTDVDVTSAARTEAPSPIVFVSEPPTADTGILALLSTIRVTLLSYVTNFF